MINKTLIFTGAVLLILSVFTLFAIIDSSGGSLNGTIIATFIFTLATITLTLISTHINLKIAASVSSSIALILSSIYFVKILKLLQVILQQFPLLAVANIVLWIGALIMLLGTILRLSENLQNSNSANGEGTPGEIEEKTFLQYCFQPLKKYADFKGRARRQEYWGFYLLTSIVQLLFTTIIFSMPNNNFFIIVFLINLTVSIGLMIPGLAVFTRRLHDTGRSGWKWLIGLIPLFGQIALLVMLCENGETGTNKYGANPKG